MSTGRKIVLALVVIAVVVYGIRAQGRSTRRKEGARILDGYVQATGGAAAYQAIRTIVIHGKGTLMGNPVVAVSTGRRPAGGMPSCRRRMRKTLPWARTARRPG